MILLDTCALLWWTLEPEKLSKKALKACTEIPQKGACISSISIWEIGIKMKRKLIDIGEDIAAYTARLNLLDYLEIVPVDDRIWIKNLSLDWQHPDPADRTIVATALLRDLPIVTKDSLIASYYRKIIW